MTVGISFDQLIASITRSIISLWQIDAFLSQSFLCVQLFKRKDNSLLALVFNIQCDSRVHRIDEYMTAVVFKPMGFQE